MRHRDRHLVSDFMGPPSWISRRGGHHVGSKVMGPLSWIGSRDVIDPITGPILLSSLTLENHASNIFCLVVSVLVNQLNKSLHAV